MDVQVIIRKRSCGLGMSTLAIETHALAEKAEFTDNDLIVYLVDGRKVTIPTVCSLDWKMP